MSRDIETTPLCSLIHEVSHSGSVRKYLRNYKIGPRCAMRGTVCPESIKSSGKTEKACTGPRLLYIRLTSPCLVHTSVLSKRIGNTEIAWASLMRHARPTPHSNFPPYTVFLSIGLLVALSDDLPNKTNWNSNYIPSGVNLVGVPGSCHFVLVILGVHLAAV